MEMGMRAVEDTAVGGDLTPPLSPVAFVLQDSTLGSHCSACFSPLPPCRFPPCVLTSSQNSIDPVNDTPVPLYCSSRCSSLDSPIHFASAGHRLLRLFLQSPPSGWENFSDLLLSLRLLHIFKTLPQERDIWENSQREDEEGFSPKSGGMERIAGLMTNRDRLLFGEGINRQYLRENAESLLQRIREGAKLMAKARRICIDDYGDAETLDFSMEEMVLCLVLTNAVEVHDNSGCSIGVAVYGTSFSWINHSCSPNACYRFLLGQDRDVMQQPLRITPATKESGSDNGIGKDLVMESDLPFSIPERNGYGPRVIVRSIKDVRKGEEVTIAYTDLLQPKEMRQAELWSKYRFSCSCQRCCAVPMTYLDFALQAPCTKSIECLESPENVVEELLENIDDAITDYLSFGDPRSCCEKLENLLNHGHMSNAPIELEAAKSPQISKMNPLHYLCQNAYTTLASAYKVQAMEVLAITHEAERQKLNEAFTLSKTSAAYSLLLAGVVHHLYIFESALAPPVSTFYTNAGESLLNLARSPFWNDSPIPIDQGLSPSSKCNKCHLSFKPNHAILSQDLPLEEAKTQLFNCIADITPKNWCTLASQSSFLKFQIRNPIDFSWMDHSNINMTPEFESHLAKPSFNTGSLTLTSSLLEPEEYNVQFRMNLFQLGFHCLGYGALVSSICYGPCVEL